MRSLALLFALAVPVATASAAPTTTVDPHPLSKSESQARHVPWVRMTFCNPTMKPHDLQVGKDNFPLEGHRTLSLAVKAGSIIHVSSSQDSRVNDQIAVTAADAGRTVIMH